MFIEVDKIRGNGDVETILINTDNITEIKEKDTEAALPTCYIWRSASSGTEVMASFEEIKDKIKAAHLNGVG